MKLVENIGLPSEYLDCYEAVLVTILRHMGLPNESLIMGTQAYFQFVDGQAGAWISSRFNEIHEEWYRVFDLSIERYPIANESALRDGIATKLRSGIPVCLPLDLSYLPYTPHFGHLHQTHFISIFGYEEKRYFVVCPYYRFIGWIGEDYIHTGFFALTGGHNRNMIIIPAFQFNDLTSERVRSLVQESCQYMLGLKVPPELKDTNSKTLGLLGIQTFASYMQRTLDANNSFPPAHNFLALSRQLMSVGNSRYWFCKLIEQHEHNLFSPMVAANVEGQAKELVPLWRGIGRLLGSSVHVNKWASAKTAIIHLEQVSKQEEYLFSSLLEAFSSNEQGKL